MNRLKIALTTASVLKNVKYEENAEEIVILIDISKNK